MASTTPKNHLTPSIQEPPLGKLTANVPTRKNGTPRPSAKVNMTPVPSTNRCDAAIQMRIPPSTGPVHGAATSALTRPRTNAPGNPIPPTVARRLVTLDGRAISKAPNIDAESKRKTMETKPTTHLFERAEPKRAPESAAPTPRAVNMTAIPSTNTPERAAACPRLLAVRAPNTLTVMAIIG